MWYRVHAFLACLLFALEPESKAAPKRVLNRYHSAPDVGADTSAADAVVHNLKGECVRVFACVCARAYVCMCV